MVVAVVVVAADVFNVRFARRLRASWFAVAAVDVAAVAAVVVAIAVGRSIAVGVAACCGAV